MQSCSQPYIPSSELLHSPDHAESVPVVFTFFFTVCILILVAPELFSKSTLNLHLHCSQPMFISHCAQWMLLCVISLVWKSMCSSLNFPQGDLHFSPSPGPLGIPSNVYTCKQCLPARCLTSVQTIVLLQARPCLGTLSLVFLRLMPLPRLLSAPGFSLNYIQHSQDQQVAFNKS